jgi:hypothetical protein
MPDYPNPGTFEMITVSNAVKTITAAIITPVTGVCAGLQPFYALISVSADAIRYTMDGTAPVAATTGHLMAAGDSMMVSGKQAMMKLKMIRETGDALVAVTCFF